MKVKKYLGYDVYSDGRIRSNGLRKVFLKGFDTGKGYVSVKLKGKNYYVHKVVASCFIGKRPPGYTVNHKDGNKKNNNYLNLEYISRIENYQHALDTGLKKNIGQHLTTVEASQMIEFYNNTKFTQNEIASWFGFSRAIFRTLKKDDRIYKFRDEL